MRKTPNSFATLDSTSDRAWDSQTITMSSILDSTEDSAVEILRSEAVKRKFKTD